MLRVSSLCVIYNGFYPPSLCNARFTNKGTTKKIELCRSRQSEKEGEGGRPRGRGRGNASVKNLLIINYQQHIRLGLTIKRVEGVRLGQDHR